MFCQAFLRLGQALKLKESPASAYALARGGASPEKTARRLVEVFYICYGVMKQTQSVVKSFCDCRAVVIECAHFYTFLLVSWCTFSTFQVLLAICTTCVRRCRRRTFKRPSCCQQKLLTGSSFGPSGERLASGWGASTGSSGTL